MPIRNPPHPGHFIRDEIVEANDLTVDDAAALLDLARPTLSKLLNGRADLSAAMAYRIEQVFQLEMRTLLAMQSGYDESKARRESAALRLKPFQRALVQK